MICKIPYARRVALFFLLSLADFALTRLLLEQSPGSVYESNPVASWFLRQFDWLGLAAFKAIAVAAVVALIVVISYYRPLLGRLVLNFGCTTVLGVALYSAYLLLHGSPRADQDLQRLSLEHDRLVARLRASQVYSGILEDIRDDLIEGRCNLADGVRRLAQSAKGSDPGWLRMLHGRYPNQSDEQCLADNLVDYTLGSLRNDPGTARRMALILEQEFRQRFGTPAFAWRRDAARGNS